ncbi:hypothetical protein EMIHUDRAFT_222548 [Emiliania huxleyi CCMP1516]|nr:hypothetical protein EMIHUDRAFT_222548 [Emiliania huxleyi CCMP1516]EOD40764.1 hypothetical protein EMIHUDRAFT_222548 [Emiliania huxleyi CCMP1516]|eukprot:XP_005793193.1 hypothetical protein EMIHUDRAFT_222548 [Emiliania huxleyi CCMP1516]
MPPGLQQSATQRVSQCLLSTMCSQREEPARQMSQAQEDDLRGFYDQLMRRLQADGWAEGWSAVKSQILEAAGSGSVLCGRFGLCDIVVGHEKRGGVEGENLLIGRVQFIALRTAHEVAIFDCWSKCGTRTVERSDGRAPLLSSRPGSRRVLLFAPGERFVLEVGETARVTFNPRAAAA